MATGTAMAAGTPRMCSCCGTKTMAIEYTDRIVVKAGAHFLIIPKPLTEQVA